MDEKHFGQLLAAIEGLGDRLSTIEKDIANIKENMLTKYEGLAVSSTLVQIALESAAENARTIEQAQAIIKSQQKNI